MQVMINVLKNFKDIIQLASQPGASASENMIREKLYSLLGITKGLQNQMKNPYFKAFFSFL
jgi:hypothetical protein